MKMFRIFDKFRRTRRIISVFTKYGLDYFFDKGKAGILAFITRRDDSFRKISSGAGFCLALQELGPTFIKLGQILSTRPDLLPPEFIKELEKLQDQTPPFESTAAIEIVERELKKPLGELFRNFESVPVAAASLSQVHRAKMHDGRIVAVKIQRPGIRKTIEIDLDILQDLAGFVENRIHNGWNFRPQMMVEEFRKAIRKELDFVQEANHLKKFKSNFRDIKYIRVPEVYWELTTPTVLTMEFIEGIKINEVNQAQYEGKYDPKLVAIRSTEAMLKQVFEDGFFHADPHPANLFVQPPANIVMLDVGMVGYLDKRTKILGTRIIKALVNNDVDIVISCFEDLRIIVRDFDRDLLRQDMSDLFAGYMDIPLKDVEINRVAQDIMAIISRHNLTLPSNLVLMIKALSMIESTGKDLYPELDMMTIARRFVRKISKTRFSPENLIEKTDSVFHEGAELIEQLPGNLNVIINKIREGKLRFVVESEDYQKIARSIDRSGTCISLSIIISVLIITSSVLIYFPHSTSGIPVISVAGYSVALVLIIWLILSSHR
ncbi:MAG: ABC transporter [Bacteroidales bacterium]|jgi:ubiquinone biosynthesis protein|nr:ABC transporter [Bacteroidales bacterium]